MSKWLDKMTDVCTAIIMVLVAMIVVIILTIPALVEKARAEPATVYAAVSPGKCLNVRADANRGASVVAVVDRGDTLDVDDLRIQDGWLYVSKTMICSEERGPFTIDGWVWHELVSYDEPGPYPAVIRADGRVRLRQSPGGTQAGWIAPGEKVELLTNWWDGAVSWSQIVHNGKHYWVMSEYAYRW